MNPKSGLYLLIVALFVTQILGFLSVSQNRPILALIGGMIGVIIVAWIYYTLFYKR